MNVFGSRAAPEVPTPEDASRAALAAWGRLTGGLSPQALGGAWLNVLARLATSPGRQAELAQSFFRKSVALTQFAGRAVTGQHPALDANASPYARR